MSIVIGAEITTEAGDLRRDIRRDARLIKGELGGAFRSVGRIAAASLAGVSRMTASVGRGVTGMIRSLGSIRALVGGAVVGLGFDRLIKSGAQLEVQMKSLAGQMRTNARDTGLYVAQVNNASKGLLDFSSSASIVADANLFGIPPEATESIVRYASAIAAAKGEADNAGQFIAQVLKGASGRFGFDELRRVGVDISERDVAGLSQQQATAKIVGETVRQLRREAERLNISGEELLFTYSSIGGNVKDITAGVGQWLGRVEAVRGAIGKVAELTGAVAEGLRGPNAGDFGKALIVTAVEFGKAAGDSLLRAGGRGILELAAIFAEALGAIDWASFGRQIVGGIGKVLMETLPAFASAIGLSVDKVADLQRGDSAFGAAATVLRERAAAINPLEPLRDFGQRASERFSPSGRLPAGPNAQAGLAPIDLADTSLGDLDRLRKDLTDPGLLRKRAAVFQRSLREDPETAASLSDQQIARQARQLAQQQIAADRALARVGLPGSGVNRSDLAELDRIAGGDLPAEFTAEQRRNAIEEVKQRREQLIGAAITPEGQAAIDAFNRRAQPARSVGPNPFETALGQLGLDRSATLTQAALEALGVPTNAPREGEVTREPESESSPAPSDFEARQEARRQAIIERREAEKAKVRRRLSLPALAEAQAERREGDTTEAAREELERVQAQVRRNAGPPLDDAEIDAQRTERRKQADQLLRDAGVDIEQTGKTMGSLRDAAGKLLDEVMGVTEVVDRGVARLA